MTVGNHERNGLLLSQGNLYGLEIAPKGYHLNDVVLVVHQFQQRQDIIILSPYFLKGKDKQGEKGGERGKRSNIEKEKLVNFSSGRKEGR